MYVAVSVGTLSEAIKNGENNNTEIIIVLVTGAVLGIIATIYVTLAAKKEMNKILAENHPILDQTEESLNT